jgi:uncharacterized protein (DUF2235 family)
MKRIAIFCDGTWNSPRAANQTNVVRLAETVLARDAGGTQQMVIYQRGVGTGSSATGAASIRDRILGGVFGNGLTANIEEAYKNLILAYEPGDEIMVFGFSRGAYTARSLVGMIRACGILPRRALSRVDEAMEYYRSRDPATRPGDARSIAWRARMSPDVATSQSDLDHRRSLGLPTPVLLRIAYMGIWDTVGELGVPSAFGVLAKVFNSVFQFHDAKLTSMVMTARHAVAIDERRRLYPPALWDNLDRLNGDAAGTERPLQQLWFAGDHTGIGGGGGLDGLSSISLNWVAEGASAAGLALDGEMMAELTQSADPLAPISGIAKAGLLVWVLRIMQADRTGVGGAPVDCDNIAPPARERADALPRYRPKTIRYCL